MIILTTPALEVISVLFLRHHEEVWDHARRVFELHPDPKLLIISVPSLNILDNNPVIRGPNIWDSNRMHILGRIVARKDGDKTYLVDRGGDK